MRLDRFIIPAEPVPPRDAAVHFAIGCAIGFALAAGLLFGLAP